MAITLELWTVERPPIQSHTMFKALSIFPNELLLLGLALMALAMAMAWTRSKRSL